MSSPTPAHRASPAVRGARSLTVALAGALVFTVAPALSTSLFSSASAEERLLPGRDLVSYTVKRGDTASSLAVKHHAWTRELIAHNKLGSNARLRVGQKITIPVVTSPVPKTRATDKSSSSSETSGPSRATVRKVLDQHTSTTTNQIAAYYQGIGAVRRHGVYTQSRPYVANVLALRNNLRTGWNPA